MGLVRPTHASKGGMLRAQLARVFRLAESRKRTFSAVALALWNLLSPVLRLAPILLTFCKNLRPGSDSWLGTPVGEHHSGRG